MSIEYIDILIILLVILLVIYWSLLLYFYCERWHLKRPERSTKNERRPVQGSSLSTIPHQPKTAMSSFDNHPRVQNGEPTITSDYSINDESISPMLNIERNPLSSYKPREDFSTYQLSTGGSNSSNDSVEFWESFDV